MCRSRLLKGKRTTADLKLNCACMAMNASVAIAGGGEIKRLGMIAHFSKINVYCMDARQIVTTLGLCLQSMDRWWQ
jgi:hypothetical protein